jgi:aminomethyltransferase
MPVYFPSGIIKEHLHCRQHASIFDVSHMGQIHITGADRLKLLEIATVGNWKREE